MGNAFNKQESIHPKKSLSQIIDYVAANYIVTQNFKDMKNLSDMNYCNKLVILTSKIINNSLSNLEVEYLSQRLKGNDEVNYMNKDKVMFLDKDNLQSLDVRNQTQKRRLCIGIAKHYVKVAHLFAAISTTINPTYTYNNEATGEQLSSSLAEKETIPENTNVKIERVNICNKRIDALVNNEKDMYDNDNNNNNNNNNTIKIKPNFCQMNYDAANGKTKSFSSEPGIPELEKLYYDKYDYDKGDFIGMTDEMRTNVYEQDVEQFYKTFTGKDSIPVDASGKKLITSFSQIPLKDFHKSVGCKVDGVYNKTSGYEGSLKDKLFKQYAEHVKTMMSNTTVNQNKLLAIIDKLFVFNINIQTNKKEIVVNPRLNEKTLQLIVEDTRKLIIELYIGCEHDFLTGLEIFEAIVEKQIIDTSKQQIELLQTNIDTTLASSDISETIKPTDELEVMQVPENEEPENEEPETVGDSEPLSDTVPSFKSEVENEIIKEDNDKNISLPMTTSEITTSSVFSPATVTTTETTTEFPPATTTVFPPATTTVFPPATTTVFPPAISVFPSATSVFPPATETTTSTVFPPASTYATIKQPTIAPIMAHTIAPTMAPAFPIAPAPIAVGGTRKKKYNKYFKKTRKGMRKY